MKKIYTYTLAAILLVAGLGCKKTYETSVFSQSPQERTQQMLKNYQNTLTAAPYGWITYIYPNAGGAFTFYFKFDSTNRVVSYADMSTTSAQTSIESSYRLQNMQITTLIFDTYTYLHVLSDPDPNVAGGTAGQGLKSDFEYYLNSVTDDTIRMTGAKNGVRAMMVRATASQAAAFPSGRMSAMITAVLQYAASPNNSFHFTLPDSSVVGLDINGRTSLLKGMNKAGTALVGSNAYYSFTELGIHLAVPFIYNNYVIQDIYWDKGNGGFYLMIGNTRINIYPGSPLFPLYPSLGTIYTRMYIPQQPVDGTSATFINVYQQITNSLKSVYNTNLYDVNFVINSRNNTMQVIIRAQSATNASLVYTSAYIYNIVSTGKNVKFSYVSADVNGTTIKQYMQPLLNYFDSDNFTLDYYTSPTVGLLGKMASVEHGDFYFTAILSTR